MARAAEDPVAAVDELAFGCRRRDELGHPRGERREAPPDAADGAEGQVLADPLVADVGQLRLRLGRLVGAGVPLHLAAAPAGHPVELDVIGRPHDVAEVGDHVGERLDGLDGVQVERRHTPQCHLGDDPERTEADAGDAQQLGVGRVRRHE